MELGLNQLANSTYPPIAKMVNIVANVVTIVNHNNVPDYLDNILFGKSSLFQVNTKS